MKKAIALSLVLCICMSLCACDTTDYKKAVSLFDNGEYEEALERFLVLGDYEDSKTYVMECRYQIVLKLMDEAKYATAIEKLEQLGDYKDCKDLMQECDYQTALAFLEEKEYAQALEILENMSDYKDCKERISKGKWDALYDCIKEEGGRISFQIGNNSSQKLYMEANDNGSINIIFQGAFLLLFVQENVACTITLEYGNDKADYEITCSSNYNWKVTEVLRAKINVADFSTEMELPSGSYQHTTEKPDEIVVLTTIPSGTAFTFVLEPTHAAICENLSMLLEKTDVGITTADLGFSFD